MHFGLIWMGIFRPALGFFGRSIDLLFIWTGQFFADFFWPAQDFLALIDLDRI